MNFPKYGCNSTSWIQWEIAIGKCGKCLFIDFYTFKASK